MADTEDSPVSIVNIMIYFALWYFFTCTTYGVNVPAGLFLPGILIGCSIGLVYMEVMTDWFGFDI